MSESLAKLAQKIDFSKTACEEVKKEPDISDNTEEDASSKDPAAYQSTLWPWDSVRNKLRWGFYFTIAPHSIFCLLHSYLYYIIPQNVSHSCKLIISFYLRGLINIILTLN
jgi:hypothetical protein